MVQPCKIGLGTFPFSNVFNPVSETEAARIVRTFFDQGGNYIQTAPYYDGVDPLVGKILKGVPREKYFLSTLCVKNRQSIRTGKYESIIAQCNDSLEQLGVEYIDLFMTSTTKASDAPFSETIAALHDLQVQGKIREIGVANVNLAQLKEYNKTGYVRYAQNRFSLLCQSTSDEFNSYCAEHHIGLIPYNSVEHGLLTDKVIQGVHLRSGDLREGLKHFRPEAVLTVQQWVSNYLKPIAEENSVPVEALAIWWTLQQPNLAVAVVGATKAEQVVRNFKALIVPSDPQILSKVNNAYKTLADQIRTEHSMSVTEFLGNVYG
jgi:aryl-alcohol dehydrogenase-like predicted oxidoreductase